MNQRRIYSRSYCQVQNINFRDVADREVIKNTRLDVKDCVRFYYKEKTMTLYRNEGIKEDGALPHVPIPVYLLFDEEIMCLETDGSKESWYFDVNKEKFSSLVAKLLNKDIGNRK